MNDTERLMEQVINGYLSDNSLEDLFEDLGLDVTDTIFVLWYAGHIPNDVMEKFLGVGEEEQLGFEFE
jgi:hypothetical protein